VDILFSLAVGAHASTVAATAALRMAVEANPMIQSTILVQALEGTRVLSFLGFRDGKLTNLKLVLRINFVENSR
jgi:hypothetical protein